MLETLRIPGEEELLAAKPGQVTVLTGVNPTLAALLACRTAAAGRKTLLVMENGQIVNKAMGARPKKAILEML